MVFYEYSELELCEALGEDGRWYFATVEKKNPDKTYRVSLQDFPVQWRAVGAHNLRKISLHFVKKFLKDGHEGRATSESIIPSHWFETDRSSSQIQQDDSFPEFAEPRRISIMKDVKIRINADETFTQFDEKHVNTKHKTNKDISPDVEQRRRVSFVNTDESSTENYLPPLPTIESSMEEFAKIPTSPKGPAAICINPFSFLMFASMNKKKQQRPKRPKRKPRAVSRIRDHIRTKMRRTSNLFHGSGQGWTLEELEQYKAEIEAELNRLRNKSIGSAAHTPNFDLRRGTTHQYVSLRSSNLIGSGYSSDETVSVFQRTVDETMELDFQRRVWLSNQWDMDRLTMQSRWKVGDQLEILQDGQWKPAFVHSCCAENNTAWLLLSSLDSDEDRQYRIRRFGNQVRPLGYLEPDLTE